MLVAAGCCGARWRPDCVKAGTPVGPLGSRIEDRMAEIRVEQKRGGSGRAIAIAIGLVVIVGIVYYFLYYRNG